MMIELPFPPASLSGHAKGNGQWRKIKQTKELRALAKAEAGKVQWPDFGDHKPYTAEGDITVHITFVPPTKQGDRLNFLTRAKPLLDGVADALGVNDARFVPKPYYCAPEKPGRVEIRIGKDAPKVRKKLRDLELSVMTKNLMWSFAGMPLDEVREMLLDPQSVAYSMLSNKRRKECLEAVEFELGGDQ